ncbi:hypothetical protein BRD11_02740 [Halobacteriales archaeon SW_12_69_24]|nr:MAG: hypothetical protein BRD11_02740 [Halobacteriales archaeon SW_12_69_24]
MSSTPISTTKANAPAAAARRFWPSPARELADNTHGPLTTFNDFEAPQSGERLDHVLVDGVAVDRFGVLADLDDRGRYPSDHFAVLADLTLGD